ncbi:DNA topoisomerase IV subunit B [Oryzomicrobium terrae]|uniref:DNA topoisomerase 4 subunit B n=1 Tax=Oryzomicrobium terrae TaxID=1735038 RepID=A0A5C1EAK9_9RHOO|nr:DNA topoisomerase IV subunit B [Oryzomicrobium terrae]QEL65725.1 DNA topoisomerase IV subunit B [Oryzomicrobium terrae]
MSYNASDIAVLKGLEPVKLRPGMYTRTENPLHIIQEVIDNAADEAIAGHAKRLSVILHDDGSVSVADDGRGIPVEIHPVEGVPTVEVVYTRLHAGGKFNKGAGGAYTFSGGLHGVGVSVTNALSTRLEVEVVRDGAMHRLVFSGGDVIEPLVRVSDAPKRASGTRVRVWPDAKYFDSPAIPRAELERILRSKAVLLPRFQVNFSVEKTGEEKVWLYESGMRDYLAEQLSGNDLLVPMIVGEKYIAGRDDDTFAEGEGAAWAVAWSEEGGGAVRESYVNLIPTPGGGTHEAGLREGVFGALKTFMEHHSLVPKGVKLLPDDLFGRASFILSARVLDPSFQGQTKDRLNSRDAVRLVGSMIRDPFELWLNEHVDDAKKLAELAIKQAQSRLRAAQKVEKKKSSGVAVLPGKLTDCETDEAARAELFLVEGDSAGGSAKQGRSKEFQAVLPLRGKVLNTWEVERDSLYGNAEVHDIAVALGIEPHDFNDNADLSGLRYHKLIVLSDADVDGSHIQTLLLTLFCRHFPMLVARGHVYVAQPPLFRLDVPGQGKNRPPKKLYALDEEEREALLDKLERDGIKPDRVSISRFKGLGEMSAEQLWETTLNPDTRRLVQISIDRAGWDEMVAMMRMLMGKGESGSRREWMERRGNEVEADV